MKLVLWCWRCKRHTDHADYGKCLRCVELREKEKAARG